MFHRINSDAGQLNAVKETVIIFSVLNVYNSMFVCNVFGGGDERTSYHWPVREKDNLKLFDTVQHPVRGVFVESGHALVQVGYEVLRVEVQHVSVDVDRRVEVRRGRLDSTVDTDTVESSSGPHHHFDATTNNKIKLK